MSLECGWDWRQTIGKRLSSSSIFWFLSFSLSLFSHHHFTYFSVPFTPLILFLGTNCPRLLYFACKLNTFRKRVKNVVTSKGIQMGIECNKWSDVKCSDVGWSDVIYVKWFCFEFKWNEVKWNYGEVLEDKVAMHIKVTLHWGYLTVLWLFYLVCILYSGYFNLYCGCFNLFCNVFMCVYVDFIMCGCVYVYVLQCLGVLVTCVLVFIVFCIVCTVFLYCSFHLYLFLFFVCT